MPSESERMKLPGKKELFDSFPFRVVQRGRAEYRTWGTRVDKEVLGKSVNVADG